MPRSKMRNNNLELDPCSENAINVFWKIFSRTMNRSFEPPIKAFQYPLPAAAYYVSIIQMFSEPFDSIFKSIKKLIPGREINRNNLRLAKEELLSYGFIAQIYFMDSDTEIHYEEFLPVNPMLIWNMKRDLSSIDAAIDMEKLQKIYKDKFGTYGLKTINGSITALYSSRWLYYSLINNIEYNRELLMMFGRLKSFKSPYIKYYEDMFKRGLTIKALIDDEENELKGLAVSLQKKYKNIDVKFSHNLPKTTRHLISDIMAIDARKIIEKKEPSYIGTIYLDDRKDQFRENFLSYWNKK